MAQEPKGNKIVAFKDYRREVPASDVVKFVDEILSGKARSFGSSQIPPIVHHKDVTYVWKKGDKGSNVIAVAATKWDSNVLAIQELLHQLLDLLRMFCPSGNILSNTLALSSDDKLKADALRAKHALVLSILEEVSSCPRLYQVPPGCETPKLRGGSPGPLCSSGWGV
jgi:hypothetical protein